MRKESIDPISSAPAVESQNPPSDDQNNGSNQSFGAPSNNFDVAAVVSQVNADGTSSESLVRLPARVTSRTSDGDSDLDTDHQTLIEHVTKLDAGFSRKRQAGRFVARLTRDIGSLQQQRRELGSDEHIAGIQRTGWVPWARRFLILAGVLVAIDIAVWCLGAGAVLSSPAPSQNSAAQVKPAGLEER